MLAKWPPSKPRLALGCRFPTDSRHDAAYCRYLSPYRCQPKDHFLPARLPDTRTRLRAVRRATSVAGGGGYTLRVGPSARETTTPSPQSALTRAKDCPARFWRAGSSV